MEWLKKAWDVAGDTVRTIYPAVAVVESAKNMMSDAVADRIRTEARSRAYELLAKAHRSVLVTMMVQNAALMAATIPVYLLRSPWPFYVTYTCVAGYSLYSIGKAWPLVRRLLITRSFTEAISQEVLAAIEGELTQRDFIERKAVEWLGPDLKTVSDEIARYLRADIIAALANMALTLGLGFVVFRLYAIPLLEHHALR